MKFEIGQLVELIDDSSMGADKGATAVVYRVNSLYIYVAWVRDSKSHNQGNGGYYPKDFKPLIIKNQQLQFAFMNENA